MITVEVRVQIMDASVCRVITVNNPTSLEPAARALAVQCFLEICEKVGIKQEFDQQ